MFANGTLTLAATYKCIVADLCESAHGPSYLLVQAGALPDQRPVSRHILISSPVRTRPTLQE